MQETSEIVEKSGLQQQEKGAVIIMNKIKQKFKNEFQVYRVRRITDKDKDQTIIQRQNSRSQSRSRVRMSKSRPTSSNSSRSFMSNEQIEEVKIQQVPRDTQEIIQETEHEETQIEELKQGKIKRDLELNETPYFQQAREEGSNKQVNDLQLTNDQENNQNNQINQDSKNKAYQCTAYTFIEEKWNQSQNQLQQIENNLRDNKNDIQQEIKNEQLQITDNNDDKMPQQLYDNNDDFGSLKITKINVNRQRKGSSQFKKQNNQEKQQVDLNEEQITKILSITIQDLIDQISVQLSESIENQIIDQSLDKTLDQIVSEQVISNCLILDEQLQIAKAVNFCTTQVQFQTIKENIQDLLDLLIFEELLPNMVINQAFGVINKEILKELTKAIQEEAQQKQQQLKNMNLQRELEDNFSNKLVNQVLIEICQQAITDTINQQIQDQIAQQDIKQKQNELNQVDLLTQNALNQVADRILHEYICLYEIDMIQATLENITEQIESKLFPQLIEQSISSISQNKKKVYRNISCKTESTQDQQEQMLLEDVSENDVRLKKKKVNSLKSKQSVNFDKIKIDDLLDMQFFQRCFFGRKLSIKDQIIFKIYAEELLDMIKKRVNNQYTKKKQLQKLIRKQKKNQSKSPLTSQYFYQDSKVSKQEKKSKLKARALIKDDCSQQQCVNITINKTPIMDITSNIDDYRLSVSQISDVLSPTMINNKSALSNLIIPNEPISQLTTKKNEQLFYDNSVNSERPYTPTYFSQQETSSIVNNESVRNNNKSQLRSNNRISKIKKRDASAFKTPNQHLNHTIKIYQNLENQVKDILKKKDIILKQVRVKRKFENYSVRVSPQHSPLSKTQNNFSFQKNQQLINEDNTLLAPVKHFSEYKSKEQSQLDKYNNATTIIYQTQNFFNNFKQPGDHQAQMINQCPSFSKIDPLNNFVQQEGQDYDQINHQNSLNLGRETQTSLSQYLNQRQLTPFSNERIKECQYQQFGGDSKQGIKKINNRNPIIIQSTPKKSAIEIIESARKYVGKIENQKNKSVKRKRFRSRPREINTTLQQDLIEPFVQDFVRSSNKSPQQQIVSPLFQKRSPSKIRNRKLKFLNTNYNSPTNQLMDTISQKVADIRQFKHTRPVIKINEQEQQKIMQKHG